MSEISEVVIVTMPEAESPEKAMLVTTELDAPPREEDTEAEASGADPLNKVETVIVKVTQEEEMDDECFYQITCGDAKATLVWNKFLCPGINVKCVQFKDQLISPKEFVCLAGKSTLKDWKRAIRLNGTMLRKIMDSGELDFYQHAKQCSNTCRSTKIDLVSTKAPGSGDPSSEVGGGPLPSADLNGAEALEETSEWVTTIGEDALAFWRNVKEAGLLEDVVEDFQKEIQEVLKGLHERATDPPLQVKDAVLLNNVVQNFGMLDLVKKVLASHKNQMDRHREQYTRSLAALEQQCDEHRKRAKELKSKSQHLNNVLMTLTPVPAPPAPKRPRMTRAASGPPALNSGPAQIVLPLNQLSGLPLGKLLTVAGAPAGSDLGGYTLLTSPVAGPDLAADGSNVTVLAAAGQEGAAAPPASAAIIKMLGPQFQLVTLPAALQNLTATKAQTVEEEGGEAAEEGETTEASGEELSEMN
ncbi:glucocorticoid modulatory element-binding protein 2 isoform 2-T2 [Synchiropus picturatus]